MPNRIAYLPLNTYPETPPDPAILSAVGFAASLNCGVQVAMFAVDVPKTASPVGGFLINVEGMAHAIEDRSKAECERLQALINGVARPDIDVVTTTHKVVLGAALDAATTEARTYDLALLPWSADTISAQDMAQALVFGAGVPVVLVPPSVQVAAVDHIAIAWDGSRVAARALCDALPLLAAGGRVSVVTVQDDKALGASRIAQTLCRLLNGAVLRQRQSTSALTAEPSARRCKRPPCQKARSFWLWVVSGTLACGTLSLVARQRAFFRICGCRFCCHIDPWLPPATLQVAASAATSILNDLMPRVRCVSALCCTSPPH